MGTEDEYALIDIQHQDTDDDEAPDNQSPQLNTSNQVVKLTSEFMEKRLWSCIQGAKRAEPKDDAREKGEERFSTPTPMPNETRSLPSKAATKLATLAQIGEDWLYLALLGAIMALLSFSMDTVITLFLNTRLWLFRDLGANNPIVQYIGWCTMPIVLVTFSSAFVHLCSPTAIGSGIPEMKTILRGVVLNEYLTFRTLVAKIVGLTFTLGSGLPLGKEGPFVHVASIVATLLSKLVASFQGIYENESRSSEMLSAACAVGVAATFYAPIGGVLFSIEVTTVYFAVRNYWRGFFAACCGATIWRLLGFWVKNDEAISALFKTNFGTDYPFDPIELLVFSFIGASCGLAGAAYIKFHREIVQFFRRHKRISGFLQQNRFVYPIFVTLIITTVTFPPLIGKYTASTLGTHATIEHLFSNRTWSRGSQDLVSKRILDEWTTPDTGFHLHLVLYIAMLFWTSALASTIPIPSGLFIPVLKMGAAYGRLIGELMHSAFPNGINYGNYGHPASIVPGSYAVVGAAAFSGAVTHTISTSVILFEMTGQIVHIIPVILAVLIANAVCQSLQPSIYDSIIEIKKLPYLPPIASSNSISHKILVKDFMNTNLAFVWKEKCTYADLKSLLTANKKLISFPLVESRHSMKLLGAVPRTDLLKLLYLHLGRERRLQEIHRRDSETQAPSIFMSNTISGRLMNDQGDKQQKEDKKGGIQFDLGQNEKDTSDSSSNVTSSTESLSERHNQNATQQVQPQQSMNTQTVAMANGRRLDSDRHIIDADSAINSGSAGGDCTPINIGLDRVEPQTARYSQLLGLNSPNELISADDYDVDVDNDDEEDSCSTGVAKIISHYNRGSSMDEERLDKSLNELRNRMVTVTEAPEGVVIDLPDNIDCQGLSPSLQANSNNSENHSSPIAIISTNSAPISLVMSPQKVTRPRRLVAGLRQASSSNPLPSQSPSLSSRPTKSILKTSSTAANLSNMYKRNISSQSFTSSLNASEGAKPDQFHGGVAFMPSLVEKGKASNFTLSDSQGTLDLTPVRHRRKVRLPRLRVVDMTQEEQEQWEREQLNSYIDISKCQIDEAPFQLVEQTSLYRVHTLFSMLGLNHAYVTSFGKLVGIVALKDIRFAIEKMLQD